jgi:PAS domain-containing protein
MTDRNPSNTIVRYLFAVAVVMTTVALGLWLIPMTGSGGPLALFFAALLVIIWWCRLSDVSSAEGASGSPRLQPATARRKRRDHKVDGADSRGDRACGGRIFSSGSQCRLTDVNQAACRLLGYDRDELVGMTILDIIPPEDVPACLRHGVPPLTDTVQVAEWTQLRKDGTPIPSR